MSDKFTMPSIPETTDRQLDGIELFVRHFRGETYRAMVGEYGPISYGRHTALSQVGKRILTKVHAKLGKPSLQSLGIRRYRPLTLAIDMNERSEMARTRTI